MTDRQTELYQRIQAFALDEPNAGLSFGRRLARDNGWSGVYALRVIEEYKKFAFLAVAAGHPVSPSDPVDQAWHLHLVYTRSYWEEFCPNILQAPLHHGPSRGSRDEQDKLEDWYSQTLASYERFFVRTPPADIWPPVRSRFGRDMHFVRINTRQNWIVPKPLVRQPGMALLLLVLALTVTGCAALVMTDIIANPLDLTGLEFLILAIGMFSYGEGRWHQRQPDDDPAPESASLDMYEAAYLAADQNRAIDAAITNLMRREHLRLLERRGRSLFRPKTHTLALGPALQEDHDHPLERAIVQAVQEYSGTDRYGQLAWVRQSAGQETDHIREHLQGVGLLLAEDQVKASQWWRSALKWFGLLVFVVLLLVGGTTGVPQVPLILVLAVLYTLLIGSSFSLKPPYRSPYGDRVLADLRTRHRALRRRWRGAAISQPGLAVALFGPTVLAGTPIADLQPLLTPSPRSSGGGGGGGCGGGGCGGG